MKQLKNNLRLLEKFIQKISKGYYPNFNEYRPDRSKQTEINDHTLQIENNEHLNAKKTKRKYVKK
jgi:hypothetical protein